MILLYIYLIGVLVACFAGGVWWRFSGHPMGDTELAIILVSLAWPLVAAFTAGHVSVQIYHILRERLPHGLRLHRKEG